MIANVVSMLYTFISFTEVFTKYSDGGLSGKANLTLDEVCLIVFDIMINLLTVCVFLFVVYAHRHILLVRPTTKKDVTAIVLWELLVYYYQLGVVSRPMVTTSGITSDALYASYYMCCSL